MAEGNGQRAVGERDNDDESTGETRRVRAKNVMVTGGCGFIGSAFVRYLLEETKTKGNEDRGREHGERMECGGGARRWKEEEEDEEMRKTSFGVEMDAKVVVLDAISYCSTSKNLLDESIAQFEDRLEVVRGDVRDAALVSKLLREHRVDCVVHFAAETHVDNSFEDALHFTKSNIEGTHVLLECCRRAGEAATSTSDSGKDQGETKSAAVVKRFVHVSTDEVYGESEARGGVPSTEEDAMRPSSPYAATKAAAELLAMSYHRSFGAGVIVTRCNNVYGPRQFPEKLVPKFIMLRATGRKMPVHGDGMQKRSYLFVDDVAEAHLRILERGSPGHVYNIGSDEEKTVLSIAADVDAVVTEATATAAAAAAAATNGYRDGTSCADDEMACARTRAEHIKRDAVGTSGVVVDFVADRLRNDRGYLLSSTKLTSLGWSPRTTWQDGLRATADWYLGRNCYEYWDSFNSNVAAALEPHNARRAAASPPSTSLPRSSSFSSIPPLNTTMPMSPR